MALGKNPIKKRWMDMKIDFKKTWDRLQSDEASASDKYFADIENYNSRNESENLNDRPSSREDK